MTDGRRSDSDGICFFRVTPNENIPEKNLSVRLFPSMFETISNTSKQPFRVPYSRIPPLKMGCWFLMKFHASRKLYELIEIFRPTKSKEVKWKQNFFETRGKSTRDNLHSKPTPLPLVPNLTRNSQKLFIQFLHRLKALCLRFRTVCLTCLNSENWRHDVIGKEKGRTFWNGGSKHFGVGFCIDVLRSPF